MRKSIFRGISNRHGRRGMRSPGGFTIIELLVVIVVISIITALTATVYTGIQAQVIDLSVTTDLDRMNSLQLNYKTNHGVAGKAYYSGNGVDSELNFTPKTGNIIDVVVNSTDYCIRGFNTRGTKNSLSNASIKESTSGACDRIASSEEAGATLAVPSAPVITVTLSGSDILATITPVSCTPNATKYAIRSHTNDNVTWTNYSAWSATLAATQPAADGVKYGYQAKAYCYIDASTYSPVATGSEGTYIDPITAPATPTVTANTVTTTTTYSWGAASCVAGTTAGYQYRYTISPSGYDSLWVATAGISVGFTTSTTGQTYTVQVQAQCYNTNATSSWSGTGSASYYRPNGYVKAWGGASGEQGYSLVQTSDGGYAVTGYTMSYGAGYADMFLAKYDSAGTLSWSKTWGGSTSDDYGYDLVQTSDGGYAVTGNTSAGMFLAKYDSAGTLSWSKTWGNFNCFGYSLVQTSDGGYAVTGKTAYGVSNGYYHMFLAKYDSAGTLSWNTTWSGASGDQGQSLVQTSDGGYAVAGYTMSYGAGGADMFLAKYNSAGTLSWSKTWGGINTDYSYSLVQTSDGGYAITGFTNSYGAGSGDMFLAKYDSAGTLSWSKTWGGSASAEYGYSLVQTSDGGYAITGSTNSYGAGYADMYLVKYDSAGTLSWNKTWGGTVFEYGRSLVQTSDGGYSVTGYSGSYGAGGDDMFLAKYDSSGIIANCSAPMCQSPTATVTAPTATVIIPTATITTPTMTITTPTATTTVIVAP